MKPSYARLTQAGLIFLFAAGPVTDALADYECLRGIPGIHVYRFDGPTWVTDGQSRAERTCRACQSSGDAAARAACMSRSLTEGERPVRTRFESELRSWVRGAIRETSPLREDGSLVNPTEAQITAAMTRMEQACPGLNWAALSAADSQGFVNVYMPARDCAIEHFCSNTRALGGVDACDRALSASVINLEIPVLELYQTKAATEALTTGHSAPEVMSFDDETVVAGPAPGAAPTTAESPPYGPAPGRTHGITAPQFLRESATGEARTGQREDALAGATRHRMGCPAHADFTMPEDASVCIRTGYENVPTVVARTMDDVSAVVRRLVYRDLTRFAVEQVWQSYTVALLMDPDISGGSCASPEAVRTRVEQAIGFDAYMESRTNPAEGVNRLSSCFGGSAEDYERDVRQLGLGPRIRDLATTVSNLRCNRADGVAGRSSGPGEGCDPPAEAESRAFVQRHFDAYQRRVQDMGLLRERMSVLRRGQFHLDGRRVHCGSYGNDCGRFFEWMESCAPDYRITAGCVAPDMLAENERIAYTVYRNLKETENHILTRNPELAAEVLTVDERGRPVTRTAWEVTYERINSAGGRDGACPESGGQARRCRDTAREYFDVAIRFSRKKKLDLILNQACDDPEEFAKKMLLGNPELINAYLDEARTPEMGSLLCVGLSEAQADQRAEQWTRAGVTAAAMVFAAAAAIPSGGSSLAIGLGVASGGLAAGLTAYDLRQAFARMRLESGLHHGCIGDYNRAQAAEQALEDAVIRASIDLGLGVGLFAGMSAAQKIAQLRRLARVARGLEEAAPVWAANTERAARLMGRMRQVERELLVEEYALSEIPGLTRSARGGRALTRDGRRTADAILELEEMGFPRDAINRALRSCMR